MDIGEWLRGLGLEQYAPAFANNAIGWDVLPKLTAEVFLFADNALSHPQEIAGYLATVEALPGFEHLIVPIGKGLSIAYRPGAE